MSVPSETSESTGTPEAPAGSPRPAEPGWRRRSMRRSVIDGTCFSFMLGVGEHYLPAFVLVLALGEVASGLIVTIPPAVGAILQLATPWAVGVIGSHRRYVVWCAAVQAAAFVPLALAALVGSIPSWALFAVACLYFGSGMAGGSAWTTWIGTVAPRRIQARWFGLRLRTMQIANIIGFLGAGWVLALAARGKPFDQVIERHPLLLTFAALFALAGVARGLSAYLLMRQAEPEPIPHGTRRVPVREFLARAMVGGGPSSRGVRLLCYMFAARCVEYIATPYVNPYLLKELGTPYTTYALLVACTLLGKALSLTLWGRAADRFGPERTLWAAGVAIVPLAGLWLVSTSLPWIVAVQLCSGIAWGGWELATWLLTLRHIRDDERTSLMSLYIAGNWVSIAAGSLIGGWLLARHGHDADAYSWVFGVSCAARLATLPVLLAVLGWPGRERPGTQRPAGAATGASFDAESRGVGSDDQ